MIRRANPKSRRDPLPAPDPPAPAPAADADPAGGRSGVGFALIGILLVLAWLIVCLVLRRVL